MYLWKKTHDKQDAKEFTSPELHKEEEFVIVDYEEEEFVIIKKTIISEPIWGKLVNKN